jgi:hypothetical protein
MRTMGLGAIIGGFSVLLGCAWGHDTTGESRAEAPDMVQSQSATDTNMEILRQKIKADKKLLVASNMELTDAEAKQFWPVYDSYQKDLQQINQQLGNTIMEYVDALNQGPVPNDTAEKLMGEALDVEEAEVKLRRSYADKLENVLPPTKAARYIQIESKVRALVKSELAQRIPLAY